MTSEPNASGAITNPAVPAIPAIPARDAGGPRPMTTCAQATAIAGKVVLFIGAECRRWLVEDFAAAARNARQLGVDTLAPLRLDGGVPWYATVARLREERAAVLMEGCGFLPAAYLYGPHVGYHQIVDECALLAEMMKASGGAACAALDREWDGHAAAAIHFATIMRTAPGFLFLTNWADPYQHDWSGVSRALAPRVNAWVPRHYNNWLAARASRSREIAPGEPCVQPVVDMTKEAGADDPLAIVRHARAAGATAVWLWEYEDAMARPHLVRQIVSVMATEPPVSAADAPEEPWTLWPTTPGQRVYVIQPGDTLPAIAARLGLRDRQTLYALNRPAIEAAARAHGRPTSGGGDLIFPGQRLRY